ncbi:carboxypeptidase-like regulatory domain-containing protein [Pedobacter hiemivivus]|uniref:carboxypeptidase-like regulatory domain-containing protein n=1 Tax=Pedobacter hiemivivus TaxID=2530454 RepID=UPI001980D165|nr:carboxypeptidase-like regulatory domain-containing protein [Pedobacter hiemivivus]
MKIRYFLILLMTCLFYQNLSAQNNITVTGTVTDNKGETLIGVGVLLKGTKTATSTNNQGQYSLPSQETIPYWSSLTLDLQARKLQ